MSTGVRPCAVCRVRAPPRPPFPGFPIERASHLLTCSVTRLQRPITSRSPHGSYLFKSYYFSLFFFRFPTTVDIQYYTSIGHSTVTRRVYNL